jgi:phytoene/squalene synthetase
MMGFQDPEAKKLAERCGIAFQLTNILRDLREDAQAGRIYLPVEDLEHFDCSPEQLAASLHNKAFRELMRFEIARARTFYADAARLIEMVEPESRAALWTLVTIYRRILAVIERNVESQFKDGGRTPSRNGSSAVVRPASLSGGEKVALVLRAAAMRLQLQVGGKPDWRLDA